jgi:hypothetical protein
MAESWGSVETFVLALGLEIEIFMNEQSEVVAEHRDGK